MNRNKSLVAFGIVAVLAVATFSQSFAQTSITTFKKGTPETARELSLSASQSVNIDASARDKGERGAKRMELLQQRLNLTTEQTAKIQTILQNAREKAKVAREQAGTDKEAFRAVMKENIKNIDAEIQNVLNAEQAQKYTELKAEMKTKHSKEEGHDEHRHHEKSKK